MLYKEYMDEILKEVLYIYGSDCFGHIDEFQSLFEDITQLSIIKGDRVYFSSADNVPTTNIIQALIGSGINRIGLLPIGKCFLTNILEDDNAKDIVDKSLDSKLDYLVNKMRGDNNEYGINRYLAENPNSDPNAYEMIDVLTTYNNLASCGKVPPEDIKSDLNNMFLKRRQNFIENGIGLDSAAYRLCEYCYNPENINEYPLPAVTISAMKKIASLDLYSRQQERDGAMLFDNVAEVQKVRDYFNASNQVVKPGFLDDFREDLDNLYAYAKENRDKKSEVDRD